jgi:hypothetical protein
MSAASPDSDLKIMVSRPLVALVKPNPMSIPRICCMARLPLVRRAEKWCAPTGSAFDAAFPLPLSVNIGRFPDFLRT